jgi:hypothetical protein
MNDLGFTYKAVGDERKDPKLYEQALKLYEQATGIR